MLIREELLRGDILEQLPRFGPRQICCAPIMLRRWLWISWVLLNEVEQTTIQKLAVAVPL